MKRCEACGGSGRKWFVLNCPACGGAGSVPAHDYKKSEHIVGWKEKETHTPGIEGADQNEDGE